MIRRLIGALCLVWIGLQADAQQIMYANLRELVEEQGDTVTTLAVERRSKKHIQMTGGADYRIFAPENEGMSRYLKSRCYAVRIDTALYVNCRKMRYKHFRFGNWYAPARQIGSKIYYVARPMGQAASRTLTPTDATRLGGQVGDAINVAGLLEERVFYELDPETGKSYFVGREKMAVLLSHRPDDQKRLLEEERESADVIAHYLKLLIEP